MQATRKEQRRSKEIRVGDRKEFESGWMATIDRRWYNNTVPLAGRAGDTIDDGDL